MLSTTAPWGDNDKHNSLTQVKLIALYNSQNPAIAEGARAAQQAERRVIRNQNLIGF